MSDMLAKNEITCDGVTFKNLPWELFRYIKQAEWERDRYKNLLLCLCRNEKDLEDILTKFEEVHNG